MAASLSIEERSLIYLRPEDWHISVARHHYSLGVISFALASLLHCRGSLRGSQATVELTGQLLHGQSDVPSHTTVRNWLLRLGLFRLTQPLTQTDDWIWIVDHTVQVGQLKCMVIVGLRHSAWLQHENRTLQYEDVELIDLVPIRTSTGEIVDQQLEVASKRTGVPMLIISDEGRDLHRGLALFRERHEAVKWIYDIKHMTASLLKHELEKDPDWVEFTKQANEAKRHVHQTELAFCNPPQQRGKSRYMNVDTLVAWGQKVLRWLDGPKLFGQDIDPQRIEAKLGWLETYRKPLEGWKQAMDVIELVETTIRHEGYHADSETELRKQLPAPDEEQLSGRLTSALLTFVAEQVPKSQSFERLPGSSEVLESIFGKYKTLQGETSQFGVTAMLLSIGAFIGKTTIRTIQMALEATTGPKLQQWERAKLGATIHSQRKQAFRTPKNGTTMGTTEITAMALQ
jgi:hypothetical protein